MKTTKPKLLISTGSLDRLLTLVNDYFYTKNIQLGSDGEVFSTTKGRLNNFQWRYKGGRFRFESVGF